MKYPYEYSEKEIKLIEIFKYQDIAMSPSIPPPLLYNAMAIECFRNNRQDNVSDSVRKCLLALEESSRREGKKIFRLTKDFDDLINV